LSNLPGPHIAVAVIEGFAGEVGRRGAPADTLLAEMLAFDERVAPYGNVDEFLAICAVAGIAQRALVDDRGRPSLLATLAESAIDERLRVRQQAARGVGLVMVAEIGAGRDITERLLEWLASDDMWRGVLVLETLSQNELLAVVAPETLHVVLDAAFRRLGSERRSGRRREAWIRFAKSLAALPVSWLVRKPSLADAVAPHAKSEDIEVRKALEALTAALKKVGARDAFEPLQQALDQTAKDYRNPRHERDPKLRKKLMKPH
jgi:hypothetical protein